MQPVRTACAAALAGVAVVGCGASGAGKAGAVNPATVLHEAVAAIGTLHSYEIHATARDGKGPLTLTLEVGGPTDVQAIEARPGGTLEYMTVGSYVYVNAPRAFWSTQPGMTAAALNVIAGRWLKIPTASSAALQQTSTAMANPKALAACWDANRASASYAGRATIDGVPTVELRSTGKAPGTAPGVVYISTINPKLPVKEIITGPHEPGGPASCGHSNITSGIATFSDFNKPIAITPPANAIDATKLG